MSITAMSASASRICISPLESTFLIFGACYEKNKIFFEGYGSTITFFIFLLLPVLIFFAQPILVGDLSVWITLGRDALAQGKSITQDSYTITKTLPLVYPALTTFLYGLLYNTQGIELVLVLHAAILMCWVMRLYSPTAKGILMGLNFLHKKN